MPVAKRASDAPPVPYWTSPCGRAVVYVGDCREVMAQMEPEQFHAVCTDPPYHLTATSVRELGRRSYDLAEIRSQPKTGFMNKQWDGGDVAFNLATWEAVLRVAKPGAHLLSFGGTRTHHRMVCAIEDAGWDVRDTLMWVYGSGFPKSMDVSKQIDRMMGAEREVIGPHPNPGSTNPRIAMRDSWQPSPMITISTTLDAKQWDGWGTALKPSYEPVCVARKPLPGTVAQCVMEHGTGAINIDATRVGMDGGCKRDENTPHTLGVCGNSLSGSVDGSLNGERSPQVGGLGRWPANLIHDGSDEVVELFPEQAGGSSKPANPSVRNGGVVTNFAMSQGNTTAYIDSGSTARFFYTAKADADDRPHGKGAVAHPTVKPINLMKWLVRLVCAPGGTVLDPFMGSGSTGCAAIEEGMWFVGIEQSQEYADLAVGRLKLSLAKAPAATRMERKQVVHHEPETPPTPERL